MRFNGIEMSLRAPQRGNEPEPEPEEPTWRCPRCGNETCAAICCDEPRGGGIHG